MCIFTEGQFIAENAVGQKGKKPHGETLSSYMELASLHPHTEKGVESGAVRSALPTSNLPPQDTPLG